MASGSELLQILKAALSVEQCMKGSQLQEKYKPFIVSCINSKDRKSRLSLLQNQFQDGLALSSTSNYPGEYDGSEILLDQIEQVMSYAVGRGLPWHEICFFLSFYVSCLDLVAGSATVEAPVPSMQSAIHQFQSETVPTYSNILSPPFLTYAVDYVTKSIFQHFHLYQFLLTQPQTTDLTQLEQTVETPTKDQPASLHEGVAEDMWLKLKKKQNLEADYELRLKELDAIDAEAKSQADDNLEQVYKTQLALFSDGPRRVSPGELSDMVDALAKAHAEAAAVIVSQSLLRQNVEMDFRLQQLELFSSTGQKENITTSIRSSLTDPSGVYTRSTSGRSNSIQ